MNTFFWLLSDWRLIYTSILTAIHLLNPIATIFFATIICRAPQEVVGSNPTEGKIRFSQFTLFYRVELFSKTNIKLKLLKLKKQN